MSDAETIARLLTDKLDLSRRLEIAQNESAALRRDLDQQHFALGEQAETIRMLELERGACSCLLVEAAVRQAHDPRPIHRQIEDAGF